MSEESNIINSIVIGAVGGALAGLTVVGVQYCHEKWLECRDRKRVYKWMHNEIGENGEGNRYLSIRHIASHTNLTEDRVRYICSIHQDIYLSTGKKEDMWGVEGLSGRGGIR